MISAKKQFLGVSILGAVMLLSACFAPSGKEASTTAEPNLNPVGINQSLVWLDQLRATESDSMQAARAGIVRSHYVSMLRCNTHQACKQFHKEQMSAWAHAYLTGKQPL